MNSGIQMNVTWLLLPMAAAVSFVWNASRYESTEVILKRATRMFLQILVFMVIFLGVLAFLSYKL
jgi:succinate dehydrogenase hydrophobic anchor subunit